jgi:hypothetical protein
MQHSYLSAFKVPLMKKQHQESPFRQYRTFLLYFALVIAFQSLLAPAANAAFLIKRSHSADVRSVAARLPASDRKPDIFQRLLMMKPHRQPIHDPRNHHPPQGPAKDDLATTSLVAGIMSLCALSIAAFTLSPALFIVGSVLSIMAVIFGAIGLKSTKKRIALIGLIMGGVGLVALTLVIAIAMSNFTIF